MNRPGFRHVKYSLILAVLAIASGCATSRAKHAEIPPSTLESQRSPEETYTMAERFLLYYKGYTLRVRDPQRGLLVTDWVNDTLGRRYQITLRVMNDISGSLVSAHRVAQVFDQTGWIDIPPSEPSEPSFLAEFNEYLTQQKH